MPIVSGFVVSKMNPISHVGNIRLLCPVVMTIERKEDNQAENDHTKDAEEPKESLSIMPKIAAIIFLVSFTNFLPFISKHGIDLTDMHLHLCGHPLAFFGKLFLNFQPVSIIDIYRQKSNQVEEKSNQVGNEVHDKSNQVKDLDT